MRANQYCETAHSPWIKLHHLYAGKATINELSSLNNLLAYKYKAELEMGDHLAQLESQFEMLKVTGSGFDQAMKDAISLSWLMDKDEYAPVIAFKNSLPESMATRS